MPSVRLSYRKVLGIVAVCSAVGAAAFTMYRYFMLRGHHPGCANFDFALPEMHSFAVLSRHVDETLRTVERKLDDIAKLKLTAESNDEFQRLAFQATLEIDETLTNLMIDVDSLNTNGNDEVRALRKDLLQRLNAAGAKLQELSES